MVNTPPSKTSSAALVFARGRGALKIDPSRHDPYSDWEFNDLAALGAQIGGARWVLVTLLDPAEHCNPLVLAWSGAPDDEIATLGTLVTELAHEGNAVVIPDLREDPRFAQHPAVRAGLKIRFFAGIALLTHGGRRLGVLAVLDRVPRQLTQPQQLRLQLLARQISTVLLAPHLQHDLDRLKSSIRRAGSDHHAQMALRSIGDGVVTTDPQGHVTFMNAVAEHLTGWSLADAAGKRLSQVVTLKDEGGQNFPMPDLDRLGFGAGPLTARTLLVRRDGHEISVEGTFAPILADDRSTAGTVFAFRNVTLARRAAAELDHQATHDALTGLANRRAIERRIGHALRTAPDIGGHALLYLDLDQFKLVNDSAGHLAGDELLRQLSGLLKQQLRDSDMLARLGGDEFGVLLENSTPEHAALVAEKLRSTVERFRFVWRGRSFNIGVSIGLVNIRHDAGLSLNDILSHADEACYVAKARGRNRVHVYEPGEHERGRQHTEQEWRSELQAALREERLFLCSQPIVRLQPGNGGADAEGHVEVLLRLRATQGTIVPPMAFLPAAERYQLTPALDRWVVGAVARHLADDPGDRRLHSINLSRASLLDEGLPGFVASQLRAAGVPAERLCFEISESAAIAHLNRAIEAIDELRALGCSVGIDDFGSGMSSFGYLRRLQVDYLKINGSLVQGIVDDPVHHAMVESINRIGHLMQMRTIAGFVEDEATLEAVRAMGIDGAQGYALGRPGAMRQHRADA